MAEQKEKQQEERGFSTKVVHRDPLTGQITHKTPYRMRMVKSPIGTGRIKLWERPVGSGNLWKKQTGEPAGRWVPKEKEHPVTKEKYMDGEYDPQAAHIAWEAPLSADEQLKKNLAEKSSELDAVKKELALLQAERLKKEAAVKAKAAVKQAKAEAEAGVVNTDSEKGA